MKNKWTKIEAVDWLKKQLAMGERETVEEVNPRDCMDYVSCLEADVDPKTMEFCGFTICPVDLSEREQSFEVEMEWGRCSAAGLPDRPLDWKTEPPLSVEGYAGNLDQLERDYQVLMNAYLKPKWFCPSEAWCPEDVEDLPGGMMAMDEALDNLPEGTRFFVDREGGQLYLPCEEKDVKRIMRKRPKLEEISDGEAYEFVEEHYGACYDWPREDDFTPYDASEDLPEIPLHWSDIISAVEKFKEDKFWREIYRRAPVKIQPYLQLRFFKAVNPELVGEREVFFQELLHETESAMRARDWNWLRVKTAGRAFVPERAIRAKL